jgi:hypothetical protein
VFFKGPWRRRVTFALTTGALLLPGGCSRPPAPKPPDPGPPIPHVAGTLLDPSFIDLATETAMDVSVSSNTASKDAPPERLFDHRLETAWMGAPGDSYPSFAFRLRPGVKAKLLYLTAGSVAPAAGKERSLADPFTANVRIARVAVDRDGETVGEFPVDTEERTIQTFPIDVTGGTLRVRVVETVPGKAKDARALHVSELGLLGTAPATEHLSHAVPFVHIGSFDAPRAFPSTVFDEFRAAAPFKSIDALCKHQTKVAQNALNDAKRTHPEALFAGELVPSCKEANGYTIGERALGTPFEGITVVRMQEGTHRVSRVVIRTPAGFFPTNVVADRLPPNFPPAAAGIAFESAKLVASRLELTFLRRQVYRIVRGQTARQSDDAVRVVSVCRTTDTGLECTPQVSTAGYHRVEASSRGPGSPLPAKPPRWDWVRDHSVEERGTSVPKALFLVPGPCKTPEGAATTCDVRNDELLVR